jgi:hypothetical protein
MARHEVARDDNNIGLQIRNAFQRPNEDRSTEPTAFPRAISVAPQAAANG